MASLALSAIQAALSLMYRPRMQRQIKGTTVLPFLLPMTMGEGKALHWTVEFSGATDAAASTEGVARDASDADAEIPVGATLPWGQYDKVSSVTDLNQAATATSFNPGSVAAVNGDSLLGQVRNQSFRLARGLAADCYGGNPAATPPELAGAALAIDSSGTFAGIAPGTYAEWASTEQTGALSAISFSVIRRFFTAIYDACGEMPEFVTCDSTFFNAVRDLYTAYEANARAVKEVTLARGGGPDGTESRVVTLEAGMRAVEVDGVPFVLDGDATALTAYAWNTNYVEINQLDPYRSILEGGVDALDALFQRVAREYGLTLPREAIEGMAARNNGFTPSIKLLGNRGLSSEAVVYAFAQLMWKRRNAFGKYVGT